MQRASELRSCGPSIYAVASVPGARFVDPKVLARIGNLELLARTVVDGFINGLHRAPYFGASIDFAEHRGYVAGDDIRRVDWRLYARTDRFYVKQYEADTNTNFSVLLDVSKSMRFAQPRRDQARLRAAILAACLAYLAQRQRDRVGIITFDNDIVDHVPPSAKHFNVAAAHARAGEGRAARATSTRAAQQDGRALQAPRHARADLRFLRGAGRRCSRRSSRCKFLGNDLIVFHVLDPAEIDFGYEDASSFEDLETRRADAGRAGRRSRRSTAS